VHEDAARQRELVAPLGHPQGDQVSERRVIDHRAALRDGDRTGGELGREQQAAAGAVVAELDERLGLEPEALLVAAEERGRGS